MCGIAGFIGRESPGRLAPIARAMSDTINHRGPDADGLWVDEDAGVALAHRRLSVIDLTTAGAQPMVSPSGRYVVSYNGEIYNFPHIRKELESRGHDFRGHSDTEVLVHAIEQWGVAEALSRIDGMFAFAVWDTRTRRLALVRDRAGKKPLYYGWFGGVFAFASELKALRAHPRFDDALDLDALGEFLRFDTVPQPTCIYRCVRKLMPQLTLRPMPHGRLFEATTLRQLPPLMRVSATPFVPAWLRTYRWGLCSPAVSTRPWWSPSCNR
jgi:asparagine synthase (glutamine-hydrolysing)